MTIRSQHSITVSAGVRTSKKKRKQRPYKPGSVPMTVLTDNGCLSFIYAAGHPTAQAFYPPSNRTDYPQTMVYMNLQHPAGTARQSPADWWSLTPPSHPCQTQNVMAVILFCPYLPSPTASIFRSGLSYAARTFLPHYPTSQI